MTETHQSKSEKVVIQFSTRTIKGYLDAEFWNTFEEMNETPPQSVPEILRVRHFERELYT